MLIDDTIWISVMILCDYAKYEGIYFNEVYYYCIKKNISMEVQPDFYCRTKIFYFNLILEQTVK